MSLTPTRLNEIARTAMGNQPALHVRDLPLTTTQEFIRFDPDTAGGSGVGLAISQHVARGLGGAITEQSALGAGSRFSPWLPSRQESDEVVQ